MKTGELEKHVRRVVWRYANTWSKWRHFAYQTVAFGDKPAGVYLDIVINKTANLFKNIDPEAAEKIKTDRYVDDLATGGCSSVVERMEGDSNLKFETNGTLFQILSNGSLKLKVVVTSGEQDTEKINWLGNSVLGIGWDPTADIIEIDVSGSNSINIPSEVLDPAKKLVTKRVILGIVNKPYDLLGLVSPITIRLRVEYRNLFKEGNDLDWDEEIPPKEQVKWMELLKLIQDVGRVKFPRATRPKVAIGQPHLIGYFDWSNNAYAAVIYFRWTLKDGSINVRLACSKSKVTPLKRISTPRSELNGAVLLSRLALSLVKASSVSRIIPEKVWLLGDSECTLSSIGKTSGAFEEYFGNRVGEIVDNQSQIERWCQVGINGEWWHVSSKDNAADQPTKLNSTLEDVTLNLSWQKGPKYLYFPWEEWLINRNFATRKESCIPSIEILKKYRIIVQEVSVHDDTGVHNAAFEEIYSHEDTDVHNEIVNEINVQEEIGVHHLIDPFSTNDWSKLIYRTQLLLTPFNKRGVVDIAARFRDAERLRFKYAMSETRKAWSDGRLNNLCVAEKDELVVVVGRANACLQKLYGKDYLPIIMAKSRIAV